MDVSSEFVLPQAAVAPGLASILRPVVLEDSLPMQAFLPPEPASLEAIAVASSMPSSMVLAQQFDQDILGDMGKLWNTFIDSGQVWALIIGIVIGYMVRSLTAY